MWRAGHAAVQPAGLRGPQELLQRHDAGRARAHWRRRGAAGQRAGLHGGPLCDGDVRYFPRCPWPRPPPSARRPVQTRTPFWTRLRFGLCGAQSAWRTARYAIRAVDRLAMLLRPAGVGERARCGSSSRPTCPTRPTRRGAGPGETFAARGHRHRNGVPPCAPPHRRGLPASALRRRTPQRAPESLLVLFDATETRRLADRGRWS